MSDKTLRQTVMDELEWDPSFNAQHIGVAGDAQDRAQVDKARCTPVNLGAQEAYFFERDQPLVGCKRGSRLEVSQRERILHVFYIGRQVDPLGSVILEVVP